MVKGEVGRVILNLRFIKNLYIDKIARSSYTKNRDYEKTNDKIFRDFHFSFFVFI